VICARCGSSRVYWHNLTTPERAWTRCDDCQGTNCQMLHEQDNDDEDEEIEQ
jgi:hypothetical protein